MTFDTHLINVAMAGIGISAGVAVLIALAVIGSFAWWQHNKTHAVPVTAQPVRHEQITQASLQKAA
jgi:hypothetical protein